MEFHQKLQEMRKQKGLTQEELAESLYVSRTAISKWESGRGYPNIDSLKVIAMFFGVTIDELLSSDELLTLAEEDTQRKETHLRDMVFGLLDISMAMLFFLPFFGQKAGESVQSVSLLSLNEIATYLRAAYLSLVTGIVVLGILTLALQNCRKNLWLQIKSKLSLLLNAIAAMLFVISLQPYAATFLLVILAIKGSMLIKWH